MHFFHTERDTIAQAQSGTGKTATFSIASLQRLEANEPQCQVLVLAPTRELAQQIHKVCEQMIHSVSIIILESIFNPI